MESLNQYNYDNTMDLRDYFNSHKYASLNLDESNNLIVRSSTSSKVSTPGILTESILLLKNVNYRLSITASNLNYSVNKVSRCFIYIENETNIEYVNRVYLTSTNLETYNINISFENDTNVKIGILISNSNFGHGFKLSSFFLRPQFDENYIKLKVPDVCISEKIFNEKVIFQDDVVIGGNLYNNYSDYNLILGHNSVENATGLSIQNTIIGSNAFNYFDHGSGNTAVGFQTGI
jgi:hypothetical protein